MRLGKFSALTILIIIFAAALSSGQVFAITGNFHPDQTRSFVGLVVFYNIDQNGNKIPVSAGTGVLISPRIVLTAAHGMTTQNALVIFDAGPVTVMVQNGQMVVEGVTSAYEGTTIPNPDYAVYLNGNYGSPTYSYRDVGIIVLDEAVPTSVVSVYGILPTAGLVDTLPVMTDLTLVGYGVQYHLTPRNLGIKNTWAGYIMRTYADAKLLSNNYAWSDEFIRVTANRGKGQGGISYGDSGGPVFLGNTNIILAVNSYVTNPNCVGETYHSRIDIQQVLDWIIEEVNEFG